MPRSDVKTKAIKGVTWNLTERFGMQGIKFIFGILLARLLSPSEFGLIGMITAFFLIAEAFINSGLGLAYVQKKEVSDDDANTMFYTNLAISLLLYGVLFFTAPFIASFYKQPILSDLTRVMGLVIVINAFSMVQIAQLTRALAFKKKTLISLISMIASGIIGVAAAIKGYGVWSLVVLNISERLFITAGLWIVSKWKPSRVFSFRSLKEMFRYGSWILLYGVMYQIFDNVYTLVIGKLFPFAQVGYYNQAKKYQRLSSRKIVDSVGIVTFPVFSIVRSDILRLQNMVKKFLQHTMLLVIPVLAISIVTAKPFIILFLTEKWAPMIPYFQLLCVAGILYPVSVVNSKVLLALGKSKLHFNISVIRNVLRVFNIILMYRYGVIYIILGEVFVSFITVIFESVYTGKYIQYGFFKQSKDIWKILLSGSIALIAGYGSSFLITDLWLLLISGVLLTGGTYLLLQYILNREGLLEIFHLKDIFRKDDRE